MLRSTFFVRMHMISVTILTKDSAETLEATLESVKGFDEVVILDSGSRDATLNIAKRYPNVVIFEEHFLGFGPMHNRASALATHDWILSLDSDEVLTQEAVDEIHALACDPSTTYAIQRHNFFNGKRIKWCGGWHPDWVTRLYNRKTTRFSDAKVHEKILTDGMQLKRLKHPILHTPYRSMADFLDKMQHYSTLFATEHRNKRDVSLLSALTHGWFAFFKSYILKRGFLGGKEGFIISLYNGHTTFYKYMKLSETARED